ncbi:MAG: SGNH/GDSL hydrolase family protein [Chloroflexota bacterium]
MAATSPPLRRPTPALARLALVLAGIATPILVVELVLRFLGPVFPGNYDTGAYLVRHEYYGHYHPASYQGWIRRDEYTVFVRTNAAGQRGPDLSLAKPPGTFRILLLGDSFVEAVQVRESERFADQLAAVLNQTARTDRVEIIDGSCGGWGTAQELLYLQHEGWRYQPDLVLLVAYIGNDVANNSLELELDGRLNVALKPYFRPGANGGLELLEPRPPVPTLSESIGLSLRERSSAYNLLESGVLQKLSLDDHWAAWRDLDALVEPRNRGMELYLTDVNDRWREAWTITDRLVAQTAEQAERVGSRFALVTIPTRIQVYPDAWRDAAGPDRGRSQGLDPLHPGRSFAKIAESHALAHLDLLNAFREAATRRGAAPLYFERDEHWTAAGHALAARRIAGFLDGQRLLNP